MNQPDLFEAAERRRDTGLDRAGSHAERVDPGWEDRTVRALRSFCLDQGRRAFLAEEFVAWAKDRMGMSPPDSRAFGVIFKRAARDGLIVRVGYAPASTSNCSPKCLWRARNGE